MAGGRLWLPARHREFIPLYAETVAFTAPGKRAVVPAGKAADVIRGTRVMKTARESTKLIAQQEGWLATAPVWSRSGAWADLARGALLDLWVLSAGLPAPVAGWTDLWRYVWPRDAAAIAAAFAVTGHRDAGLAALNWLQGVQSADGWFDARYSPITRRSPDDRERQLDGAGWVLWSLGQVLSTYDARERAALIAPLRPLVEKSVHRILDSLDPHSGLPEVSPDYWEVDESRVTLATCAVLAAGLDAATRLMPLLKDDPRAATTQLAKLDAVIADRFGRHGWPRHLGKDDPDIAVALLLPPFRSAPNPAALRGLRHVIPKLRQEGGGLTPGTSWHADGVSWTPETALAGLALAHAGDTAGAQHWLRWLHAHRTTAGSLPEKVLWNGKPAAVAPLSWTAALAVLTIAQVSA